MENKTILITGSTDGIGKITATELAKMGHTIIIHGRNKQKAESVRDDIIQKSGNTKIDIMIADLLSLSDIKRAATAFKNKYNKLDVLINNAGAFFQKNRETTSEGLEKTLALNLFAPHLLTQLLLELLANSPSARIINLSSSMHKRSGRPDFDDFQFTKNYKPDRAYGLSKLYLIWISQYLANQLKEKNMNISVNVCHTGAVATNFGQDADKGFFINMIFKVALLFMDKPIQGAQSSIYLAVSSEVEKTTGKFFGNRNNLEQESTKYFTAENQQKVWDYAQNIIAPYL